MGLRDAVRGMFAGAGRDRRAEERAARQRRRRARIERDAGIFELAERARQREIRTERAIEDRWIRERLSRAGGSVFPNDE